jgi:hypothetical protein
LQSIERSVERSDTSLDRCQASTTLLKASTAGAKRG